MSTVSCLQRAALRCVALKQLRNLSRLTLGALPQLFNVYVAGTFRIYIDGVMLPVRAAKEADFSRVALSNLRSIVQQPDAQQKQSAEATEVVTSVDCLFVFFCFRYFRCFPRTGATIVLSSEWRRREARQCLQCLQCLQSQSKRHSQDS